MAPTLTTQESFGSSRRKWRSTSPSRSPPPKRILPTEHSSHLIPATPNQNISVIILRGPLEANQGTRDFRTHTDMGKGTIPELELQQPFSIIPINIDINLTFNHRRSSHANPSSNPPSVLLNSLHIFHPHAGPSANCRPKDPQVGQVEKSLKPSSGSRSKGTTTSTGPAGFDKTIKPHTNSGKSQTTTSG